MQAVRSPYEEQQLREEKAKQRAKEAHKSAQRRLKEAGKESALPYGQVLFDITREPVAISIAKALEEACLDQKKARQFGAVLPLLDHFQSPDHIAAVALTAALDQLSRKQRYPTFCQNIGLAIERETRLIKFGKCDPLHIRRLTRTGWSRTRIAATETMRQVGVPVAAWTDVTRLQVGSFLVEHMTQTGLFRVARHRKGKVSPRFVLPTEEALEFIKHCPERSYRTAHSAMVCPPRPWTDLYDGGHLGNEEPFVRVQIADHDDRPKAMQHYYAADLRVAYTAANHMQGTPLVVSAEMVELQRTAWDNGIDGLYPCSRRPREVPDRLGSDPSEDDLKSRNRLAAAAYRDQEVHRPRRIKIERALQAAEELAGRTVYQPYHADYRGRLYTGNRFVTTQGQEFEKAMLSFKSAPCNDEGIEQLLMAAAGHHGMSRSKWSDRLAWGQQHREEMLAAAEDPLGRLELWRSAKDPWQYLQCCRGLAEVVRTGRTGAPVRFDQTTSGCGILSALTRDSRIGRACNLTGSTPHDIYSDVAAAVVERLKHDLEFGDGERERALSHLWLEFGIDRSICKGPVLSAPYGGSWMSIADGLVDRLDEHYGFVPLNEYGYRVATPSKYLASIIWSELKGLIGPVLEVKAWLRKLTKALMPKDWPLVWTSPMGWPMRIADRAPTKQAISTWLYGKRISSHIQDQPWESPLSYVLANKGICANLTHSFDAAFCHAAVKWAASRSMPVVSNHDCFAVQPCNAKVFHAALLSEFRTMYRPNWLMQIKEELEGYSEITLPDPPYVGTLRAGDIGSNPYLFS